MKFAHISDLHLGLRLYEMRMTEEQRYILEEITGLLKEEKPDALLISGDIYDIMITQIYIMYIDAYHPEEIVDSNEQFSYQSNISILNAMDIQRSGDANCDGETDLADAIFIMQSMANPDKYNISERGRFNGDVYETGHGITANDALEIQNTLLHKDN